jgi:DNA-binding response OmpR family regulator
MKKILIIDSSIFSSKKISKSLQGSGYEVVGTALDGDSGINQIIDFDPDLVLLDNALPDMEGFDVLQILNSEGVKKEIIVMLPAHQEMFKDNAKRFGAKDSITRPFTDEFLLEKIKS